jgi:alpha-glucosidase
MSKQLLPVYRPVANLAVQHVGEGSIYVKSARGVAELSVLAEGIFRVRAAAGRRLSDRPSWAVSKTDWPATPAQTRHTPSRAFLGTAAGSLSFRLADGAWELRDNSGAPLFTSVPSECGFAREGVQLTLALQDKESIFGLGETTGTFNKRGLIREFWNIDVLGHAPAIHPSLRALYVSIPFAISLRDGRAAGLFWDNPARQTWDLGQTVQNRWRMKAAAGELDLYLFIGPTVPEILARYTELTGRMPLPPRWALGYQQCRYSYETRERVIEVARNFRRRRIPCDVIYLDIHHMDDYRVFTFGKAFPRPADLIAKLASLGFKVVPIVDPGVKDDPKFRVLRNGVAAKAFVKTPDGRRDFVGKVWPGESRFPDFLSARVRRWWGREQNRLLDLGVAGFWNDMNEPANFALPTKTLPEDCLHESDFGKVRHAEAHNVYGMQMALASREGALARQPDRRPFVITRAGYAGVQRYAMVWTGDNSSVWEHLADSLQMLLNLSLSGVAFCGSDVGGFIDNTTPELLARWTQMAAFTPFFRNHSNIRTIDQEPWALGPETETICRRYINLRYQLLPYLYGLFVEAHGSGAPIMRPLLWHYQRDSTAAAVGDQFMLGPDLLVAPVLRQGAVARCVYLPEGEWFDFWTGERIEGGRHIVARAPLELIPLFVRAGGIIPMAPIRQFVGEREPGIHHLHVWAGGAGTLDWYEDDGISTAHERGHIHHRRIEFRRESEQLVLRIGEAACARRSDIMKWKVHVHGIPQPTAVLVNGKPMVGKFRRRDSSFSLALRNTPDNMTLRIRHV